MIVINNFFVNFKYPKFIKLLLFEFVKNFTKWTGLNSSTSRKQMKFIKEVLFSKASPMWIETLSLKGLFLFQIVNDFKELFFIIFAIFNPNVSVNLYDFIVKFPLNVVFVSKASNNVFKWRGLSIWKY